MAVRSETSRRALLQATMELLDADGPQSVSLQKLSIEAIARRAGVGKMTIYRWWPSKAALVIDSFIDNHLVQTTVDETLPPLDALREHLRSVTRIYAGPEGRLVTQLIAECQYDEATLREFRERFWDDRHETVLGLVRRCMAEGAMRSDVSPEVAAELIYSPLYQRMLLKLGPLDVAAADEILDVVLRGLAPAATSSKVHSDH
ncbi:TetR/AcrR family transcriptional regulator [Cryptosporangium phraense]|uniref:TetR/AcrR family transcriptional regulator n=1 Tax=Cryptosporangium phraense TaxID=2593070 RepID=A0A545AUW5_9ACTN|nr:TetR/AcrR family transcriptional regulator [Cryptosporangium phraense]TQS45130.1 TetR/AcrR family transcriptional regulator [Cryptosporangium phraense]